ncbi:hypothetical protein RJ639_025823, partial [Escallonia herrerae]
DLNVKPKYLLAVKVGYHQKDIINSIVTKFSGNFSIVLSHYDGRATDWEQFEWSQRAIHISARKQTKWWYANGFSIRTSQLCPNTYLSGMKILVYIRLVKKHGLEISQPAIESRKNVQWLVTKRRRGVEAHKYTQT